ncbi:MAG: hypothetical protein AAF600_01975 [Bacteroidota bacterium]
MDFKEFSKQYASEIGGEFREYDNNQSVIVMPLPDGRFQTITGHITHNSEYNRQMIQLKTKVCGLDNEIPYGDLLAESADYPYSKFIAEDGFLKVEAIAFLANTSEDMIKEMFSEIGKHADDWEFKITGKDIH